MFCCQYACCTEFKQLKMFLEISKTVCFLRLRADLICYVHIRKVCILRALNNSYFCFAYFFSSASFEELLLDDEICRAVLKAAQGIEVNDETLAIDVIDKVGSDGHFLAEKHTLNHFKDVLFFSELTDRHSYDAWKKAGGKSMVKRARESRRNSERTLANTPG